MEKKYWKSFEEQANLPVINPGQKDVDASRSLLDLIDEEIDGKPSSRRNFLIMLSSAMHSTLVPEKLNARPAMAPLKPWTW